MATKAVNNLVRQVGAKKSLSYPVLTDGSGDYKAGEMVSSETGGLKSLIDANATKFAGVAQDSAFISLYVDQATGLAVKEYRGSGEVLIGQIHFFKTTAAEVYSHGNAVYVGADAQTVTKVDPGSGIIVGYAWLENGGTVTGATGVTVNVLSMPQYPTAAIA